MCFQSFVVIFLEALIFLACCLFKYHLNSVLIRDSNVDHHLFSTSEEKTSISIQHDCHKIGPVHKSQLRKYFGILPHSCKHGQRVFHGGKLRQMVDALLHRRDCQWIPFRVN